jgi:hypothetical protein
MVLQTSENIRGADGEVNKKIDTGNPIVGDTK